MRPFQDIRDKSWDDGQCAACAGRADCAAFRVKGRVLPSRCLAGLEKRDGFIHNVKMGLGDIRGVLSGFKGSALSGLRGLVKNKAALTILIIFAAILVLAPVITVAALLAAGRPEEKPAPEVFRPEKISTGELFFPEEPDFLPPVIAAREQKKAWSAEDAAPFWTDPGDFGKDYWQKEISKSVDRLLERVP